MFNRRSSPFVGAVALALAPLVAGAEVSEPQIHGFLSQGWVTSAGNNVNGESTGTGGSGEFRELGVNLSWRPFTSILLAAQTAAVENGKAIDEDINFEYGLIDWTPFSGAAGRAGLRVGRLKLPIGFYNESRDAVFTRPGIIMPNSVYLETNGARSFGYFSLDAGGLYGDWLVGDHAIYAEMVVGGSQELGDNAEIAILRAPASGHFELDRGVVGRIADDYDGGRVRAALSVLSSRLEYTDADPAPSPANLFNRDGGFCFDQAVLSLQYNAEQWSVTAEATARHIEVDDLSTLPIPAAPFSGRLEQDPAGWYLQGAYRATPKWQWTLRYDEQIRDINDRHGHEQAATPVIGLPRHYYFARDWTVGTRYDLLPNLSVWAEFHYVDGVGWVNPLDNEGFEDGSADRYWNLFTTMVGLRF